METSFREKIGSVLLSEAEAEAACRTLARRVPERGAALRELADRARRRGLCLEGICRLSEHRCRYGGVPGPGVSEPLMAVLRKCCGSGLRRAGLYEKLSEDPEYGPVFDLLRQDTLLCCRSLLEIIGTMGKTGIMP